jgi:flagellar protein FlbD
MIRSIEHTPDTVITLDSDYKIVVRESIDEIVDRFLEYQRKIHGSELMEYLTKNLKEE